MIPLRDTIPSRSFPFINISLIIANLATFLYQLSLGNQVERFIFTYGLIPAHLFSGDYPLAAHFYPLFTAMFLHGSWFHILGNMLYLWIFGDNIEDRLGHLRYLLFYLLSGIGAALTQIIVHPNSSYPMVGASGAIAGVLGAYLILFFHSRIVTLIPIFFFLQVREIPAFVFLLFWILMQFLNGTATFSHTNQITDGVAWWAHIGGFFSGILLLPLLKKKR
jgi:membrane associated rhomboid family serine protease